MVPLMYHNLLHGTMGFNSRSLQKLFLFFVLLFVCSFFVTLPPDPEQARAEEGRFRALRVFYAICLRHRSLCLRVCAEHLLYYARCQYRAGITSRHTDTRTYSDYHD